MNFLKANLFLLITAVVALAGGAALYFLGDSAAASLQQNVDTRVALDQRVTGLAASAVNEKVIAALKDHNAEVKRERQEKADGLLKKNSAPYSVLTFDLKDKKPKAFPYDEKQYVQLSLWVLFPQEYDKAVMAMLDRVKPTSAPSEEERKSELSRVRDPNAPAGSAVPGLSMPPMGGPGMGGMGSPPVMGAPGSPAVMGSGMGPGMGPGSPAVMGPGSPAVMGAGPAVAPAIGAAPLARAGTAGTQPTEGLTPAEKALRSLVWAKSQQGWVYADKSSLFPAMPAPASQENYKAEDYWMAQVSLWVEQDILEAIQRTNQAAQEAKDKVAQASPTTDEKVKDAGVCVSPVKRLVSTIIRGYVVKFGSGAPAAAGSPAPAGPAMQYVKANYVHAESAPPPLTGRVCNSMYDVVHYEFTVVIAPRYLRQLLKNLRQTNFHTVLEWEISSATDVKDSAGLTTRTDDPDAFYYYGTDAVVRARIVGEMLLMTDWTRGRWDAAAKNWDANYPPLMPVEMLQRLAESDAGCLRKPDTDRITASGGSVGPSPAEGAPGAPAGQGMPGSPAGGGSPGIMGGSPGIMGGSPAVMGGSPPMAE